MKRGGSIVSTNELGANETSQNITLDNSESGYTFSVAAKNKSTDAGKTDPQFSADSVIRRATGTLRAPQCRDHSRRQFGGHHF
ncbi:hypothetical protein Q0F99_14025 [Rathayibacter oskolensis]|uniref:hypothetical protein n=1 Tax=Rathayibacter oskolensis TaxID=1891671 RepID=UPI00265F511C|nr:hypothetical protein [Rathayibacter oskolensis]WKK70861.1 hypothetical protein Q0F99_14025 [Rathayibacter oskolensis]